MGSQVENKRLKFKHIQELQAIVPGDVQGCPGP